MNQFSTTSMAPADLMDQSLRALFDDALPRWENLTGIKLDATSFRFGDLDIRSMNQIMMDMIGLEQEATTAFLLLEIFLRDFLEGKTFTAAQIMKDYKATTDFLARAEDLFAIVQSDRAAVALSEFRSRVIAGLKHYEADRPDVIEMVNDNDALPFLRRDALMSLQSLKPYQFLAGDAGAGPAQVIHHVFQAWDINELLLSLRDMPVNGIAVVLLRDPANPSRSYFAFAMRNGGNVILFTDRTKPVYPGQDDALEGRGGRGAARRFAQRAWANHFPYQIIPTSVDDRGDILFDKETSLVMKGQNLVPLMRISDLPPHQAIWLTMMLSLISEKFWKNAWRADEISYTSAMVRQKTFLVTDRQGDQLPVAAGYRPVELDDVTLQDVSAEALRAQVEFQQTGINDWLEARYRDRVPEDLLNLWFSDAGETLVLPKPYDGGGWISQREHSTMLEAARQLPGGAVALHERDRGFMGRQIAGYKLQTFSPTDFGTEAELRADRIFIARHNMAQFIQKQADDEFAARKDEVAAWYLAALERNVDGLVELLARHIAGIQAFERRKNSIQTVCFDVKNADCWRYNYGHYNALGEKKYGKSERACLLTDAASAPWRVQFSPRDAQDISLMTGVAVADLPDVLQHWSWEKPYTGNHLLDRIDPMESKVENPWIKLKLMANFYLSKRGKAMVEKRAADLAPANEKE